MEQYLIYCKFKIAKIFRNAIPYVQKYKVHPVNGTPLEVKDLIKLHFSKNKNGEYECPITHKEINDNSHIVVIKTTGNVFLYEAVEEMNIKLNDYKDLLNGTPFQKEDIIILQDPKDINRHTKNLASFHHIQENKNNKEHEKESDPHYGINITSETERILKAVKVDDSKNGILYKNKPKGEPTKSSSLTSSSIDICKLLFN